MQQSWHLHVNHNGDFRLCNPCGMISEWVARKEYGYLLPTEVTELKPKGLLCPKQMLARPSAKTRFKKLSLNFQHCKVTRCVYDVIVQAFQTRNGMS